MSMKKKVIALISLGLFTFMGCTNQPAENNEMNTEEYKQSIEKWRQNRLERLKSEEGWLNLVGLLWLEEGKNTLGSAAENSIQFPENAPAHVGTIFKKDDNLTFFAHDEVQVYTDSTQVDKVALNSDATGEATVLTHAPFQWFIIKRGDKYAIRLRDFTSPLVDLIDSLPAYPTDPQWRIEATFEPFDEPKNIEIPNVLGETELSPCYGELVFAIEGNTYRLLPMGNPERGFFVVFADGTSAEETYGAGRFLSVPAPDKSGNTTIDFNKAYNPPCAFTEYATCPLPPAENRLEVRITAGEKIGEHIGHH